MRYTFAGEVDEQRVREVLDALERPERRPGRRSAGRLRPYRNDRPQRTRSRVARPAGPRAYVRPGDANAGPRWSPRDHQRSRTTAVYHRR